MAKTDEILDGERKTRKKWVIEGFLEGNLLIPKNEKSNLPAVSGRVALTHYAILEQNLLQKPPRKIFLGLEIPTNVDDVCVAYQEMEAFIRALSIEKDVPITVHILGMTDKYEEWPKGIGFSEARDFPLCSKKWEPLNHYREPKNRVKFPPPSSYATTRGLGLVLEKRHQSFSAHNNYQSELVKDYIAGLEIERTNPSLGLLYYFKVLERIGKQEYGNPKKGAMLPCTLKALINDMGTELTNEERCQAESIAKWRHTKSEAHLVTMGTPNQDELLLCSKMAHFFLERSLKPKTPK